MSVNENGNLRADGVSISLPVGPFGIGGSYYWNPGSPTSPPLTVTGSVGFGGGGLGLSFLKAGMRSEDTLGYGASGNLFPFVPTLNVSIPDANGRPELSKSRVSSLEIGPARPGLAATYTWTPEQIAERLRMFFAPPAMGPIDEVSPLVRALTSSMGTIGPVTAAPVRNLSMNDRHSLGGGMRDWRASTTLAGLKDRQQAPEDQQPGGLLGMIQDYMRNNGY